MEPGARAHELIKTLDQNLQHIRSLSLKFQQQLAAERRASDENISSYEKGDLVLWNPREQPTDHLPSKLSPNWLGPFQVISQAKNDVTAKHIVLQTEHVFHVERLKAFFGTFEQALHVARHDQHQYLITAINSYTGNPFVRTSMTFNVTFEDGTIDMPYGTDLAESQQFQQYVMDLPILFPLRFPAKRALQEVRNMEKLVITSVAPLSEAFLDLRIYDGRSSSWFDSLSLPVKQYPYVTPIIFHRWTNGKHCEIEATVPFFGSIHPKYKLILTAYDIMAYVIMERPYWETVLVENRSVFPTVLRS